MWKSYVKIAVLLHMMLKMRISKDDDSVNKARFITPRLSALYFHNISTFFTQAYH